MAYSPSAVPLDAPEGLKAFLADELRRLAVEFQRGLRAVPRTTAPSNPREGQIEFATGAWAVTLGAEGLFGYELGTWVKL